MKFKSFNESLNESTKDLSLNIKIENIDEATRKDILKLLSFMEWTGTVGASRLVKVYCDGDGHFRPKITVEGEELNNYTPPDNVKDGGDYNLDLGS